MAELLIIPAIFWGLVVGMYELFAIHADESFVGMRWFTHGLTAALFAIIAVFITANTAWALASFPLLGSIPFATSWNFLPIRIAIGIIAMIKIQAASIVVSTGRGSFVKRGIGEHLSHTLVAGLLVVFAPEIIGWMWPIVSQFLPGFLK